MENVPHEMFSALNKCEHFYDGEKEKNKVQQDILYYCVPPATSDQKNMYCKYCTCKKIIIKKERLKKKKKNFYNITKFLYNEFFLCPPGTSLWGSSTK